MKTVKPKLKIGILSGVGPLAGAYVYEQFVKDAALTYGAVEDDEYPDVFVVSHGIGGVGNEAELNDEFKDEIIDGLKKLEAQGADCIGIACNTAHVYLGEIRQLVNVKVVDLLEEVAIEAAKHPKRYLVLSSRSSRDQQLHVPALSKHEVNFSLKSDTQQDRLDEVIGLVMACKLGAAANVLDKVLDEAHSESFTGIIAACTEIPLALRLCKNRHNLHIVDSNMVLSKALTTICYN